MNRMSYTPRQKKTHFRRPCKRCGEKFRPSSYQNKLCMECRKAGRGKPMPHPHLSTLKNARKYRISYL